jgi:branched-chain amino acid transport system ATP-binding protein
VTAGLEVVGLRAGSGARAQLEVDRLDVEARSLVVVTGPTDSGKTLLAAVFAGRAEVSAGVIRVDGRPLAGGAAARRRHGLAVTIADGARIAGCTVGEALRLAGQRRAAAACERFPLLALREGVRAELLSGGEQQLLQVACAWCANPHVLVLDAPTTGLADDVADQVREAARETAAGGAAVLWLDHSAGNAPGTAAWRLIGGVLSAAEATVSPPDRA